MSPKTSKSVLATILPAAAQRSLGLDEMRDVFNEALGFQEGEKHAELQLAALFGVLAGRGVTSTELRGTVSALLEHATPFEHGRPDAIDTCGTGGDGLSTFNLSTATALVVSSLEVPVIKHGNRAVSSHSGSADLLEQLGIAIDMDVVTSRRQLHELNFAFLFAPRFHASLAAIGPLRRALGMRTIVNLAAPLANPGRVRRQLVGVSDERSLKAVAQALEEGGTQRAFVVHGPCGADEVLPCGPNQLLGVGQLKDQTLDPSTFGMLRSPVEALACEDAAHASRQLHALFQGDVGPLRDALVLNVAVALVVADRARDFYDGAEAARFALDSGLAARQLTALQYFGGAQ
ncbi:MAG: anthranilate phosphoribosyltransferase [Planctomycetota bacterium]|jgi:anthranilate phosphoribosyltransferase